MRDGPPRLQRTPHRWSDRIGSALLAACAAVVVVVFGWILADLVRHGAGVVDAAFLFGTVTDAGRGGGIGPIVVATLAILLVCLLASAPVALLSGAFLAEFARRSGRAARWVRGWLDLLAAVPSIVFGLFGAAFFCDVLGLGFSIAAGGLTLACMVLPVLVRATEESLRGVPDDLRRAAAALGISKTATLRSVLLPEALPGLAVGLVLGIGRALAETAALIFTSGYVTRMPRSVLDSGRSLSVHVYDLAMNVPGGTQRAYASALVLMVLLLAVNTLAIRLASGWRRRIRRTS